ncbi:hypothetical protein GCM10027053_07660 [Intrasporangium mesophilum]
MVGRTVPVGPQSARRARRRQAKQAVITAAAVTALAGALLPQSAAVADPSLAQPHSGITVIKQTLKAGSPTIVGSVTVSTGAASRVSTTGWVTVTNAGKKIATVKVHGVEIVGPDVPANIVGPDLVAVVDPGVSAVLPVGIVGPDHPVGGDVTVGVEAAANVAVTVAAGAMTALAVPASEGDPALPNASAMTTGEVSLGTKAALVLDSKLELSSQDPLGTMDALTQGWVSFVNRGKKSGTVTVDYLVDDVTMWSISAIVGPDRPTYLPIALLRNGFASGTHHFGLNVRSSVAGVALSSGQLAVLGLPTTGAVPHGDATVESPVALTTQQAKVLGASMVTDVVADIWMGGSVLVTNGGSKPATVTLQPQMGPDPEGPAVVVTVASRTSVSVPFGFLCDAEPAGKQSLDLAASASAPGVSVAAGQVQAWALSG